MARYYGKVGFAITKEIRPGIFKEVYEERPYKGDIVKRTRRWDSSEHLNDNIIIQDDISIISDSFARANFGVMRYIRWMNQTFEITSAIVDVDRHRILLSLGGVFNVDDNNRTP